MNVAQIVSIGLTAAAIVVILISTHYHRRTYRAMARHLRAHDQQLDLLRGRLDRIERNMVWVDVPADQWIGIDKFQSLRSAMLPPESPGSTDDGR